MADDVKKSWKMARLMSAEVMRASEAFAASGESGMPAAFYFAIGWWSSRPRLSKKFVEYYDARTFARLVQVCVDDLYDERKEAVR